MRTMVALDDELHSKAKAYAVKHGITLKRLIEEALRLRLANRREHGRAKQLSLPTFRGDGLQPGVDLDDMDSVYDRMDGLR